MEIAIAGCAVMHVLRFTDLLPRYCLFVHAKCEGALATLTTSYGSLVAERLFSPQPSAISGGVFSL